MTVEIDILTANAIQVLNDRYYFDLFKEIRENEEQEYYFRDAISNIVKSMNEPKEINTSTNISNQHYQDVKRIVKSNKLIDDEAIEIYVQFGNALNRQKFQEPEEYYKFLDLFCSDRDLKR